MMRLKNIISNRAFTLIEILLVLSLLSMISIAVFRTLANGLKIWDKRSKSAMQEDVLIFFEKINVDLQNTVTYSKIPFEGKRQRISFASVIKIPVDERIRSEKDEYTDQIGRVEYDFDKSQKALYRRQANYSQALKNKFGPKRLLVQGLSSVEFVYGYKKGNSYFLFEEAQEGGIPAMIRVKLHFLDGHEEKDTMRFMVIPVGVNR